MLNKQINKFSSVNNQPPIPGEQTCADWVHKQTNTCVFNACSGSRAVIKARKYSEAVRMIFVN